MLVETLSTFPSMYDSVMGSSMMRIAQEKGILTFKAHDLRDWTHDRHRTTDDEPYGGGAGLVMKCGPIFEAYRDLVSPAAVEACEDSATRRFAAQDPSDPSCAALLQSDDDLDGVQTVAPSSHASTAGNSAMVAEPSDGSSAHLSGTESAAVTAKPHVIFLAPGGRRFDDALACELAREERLLFVCGHYEGIDERAYALADTVISLGDYVLTSGELASMVVIDAVVRKLPGVLGAPDGAEDESFADGLLEYPQYTRPAVFEGMEVPPILLSGNHAAIAKWRRERSLERTARLRPDLLDAAPLTAGDREFLNSLSLDTGDDA